MAEASEHLGKKPTCFVIMPISDAAGYEVGHFGRVYEHLLKPAILEAGYTPVRADDTVKTDYIVVGIIQKIVESEMVLCDISARNANVMYELGIRHAFNKPVVLVKDKKTEKIFDIQGLRYAEYDETLRIDAVTKDTSKIRSAIAETANGSTKDMNSIVHLAGIKTAEVPVSQLISADTQLILSAINTLERRVDAVQQNPKGVRKFWVVKDRLFLKSGEFRLGEELFKDTVSLGRIVALSDQEQTASMAREDGTKYIVESNSPFFDDADNIPF